MLPKRCEKMVWDRIQNTTYFSPVIQTKQDEVEPHEMNLFKGFQHKHKPFREFSKASKKAVQYFLEDYAKDSLCSNNEECSVLVGEYNIR